MCRNKSDPWRAHLVTHTTQKAKFLMADTTEHPPLSSVHAYIGQSCIGGMRVTYTVLGRPWYCVWHTKKFGKHWTMPPLLHETNPGTLALVDHRADYFSPLQQTWRWYRHAPDQSQPGRVKTRHNSFVRFDWWLSYPPRLLNSAVTLDSNIQQG